MSARDASRALRLADGTYLIRTDCCRPLSCAPAAGVRCCLGAQCVCPWPDEFGHPRFSTPTYGYVNPPITSAVPWRNWAIVGGITAASSAVVAGAVYVIAIHIVAVVATVGAALAGTALVFWARNRGRGPKYTVNHHYR